MKRSLGRLTAALALTALAATGITLTVDLTVTPQDSGWGAPDTTNTPYAGTLPNVDTGTITDTTLGDSGWG